MGNVRGLRAVQKAMREARKRHTRGLVRGLKIAGLALQRESQRIVPVDTSNLKNSAFTRYTMRGRQHVVYVGYTAAYAIFVHEILDNWHAPGKFAKFLEWPARYMRKDLIKIIKEEIVK